MIFPSCVATSLSRYSRTSGTVDRGWEVEVFSLRYWLEQGRQVELGAAEQRLLEHWGMINTIIHEDEMDKRLD